MKFLGFLISLVVYSQESELIPVIPSDQGLISNSKLTFALKKLESDSFELFKVQHTAKTTGIVLSFDAKERRISFVRNKDWYVFYDPDLRQIRCYSHQQLKSFCDRNKTWKKQLLTQQLLMKSSKEIQWDALIKGLDAFLAGYPDQPIYIHYYPYRGHILSSFIE